MSDHRNSEDEPAGDDQKGRILASARRHPGLCSAIVDRLTVPGYLTETGNQSYRLKSTLERR